MRAGHNTGPRKPSGSRWSGHTEQVAPRLARRLLYAILAVCVITTVAIALIRPAPAPPTRSAPISQAQPDLSIAGSGLTVSLNGDSSSYSLQKLCAGTASACVSVVYRSAPP